MAQLCYSCSTILGCYTRQDCIKVQFYISQFFIFQATAAASVGMQLHNAVLH